MKTVYNKKKLSPEFRNWLEKKLGKEVTGINLLASPTLNNAPFWRFELEGTANTVYGYRKVSSRYMEIIPHLRYMFGDCLIRVCWLMKNNTLVLDMKEERDIYRTVPREKIETLSNVIETKEELIQIY